MSSDESPVLEVRCQLDLGDLHLDVDFETRKRTIAVVGPNGAGKTTLLRTLAGAHVPSAGRIVVSGQVLFDSGSGTERQPEERKVGYVPQGYGLFPHLSARDNVAFGLLATKSSGSRAARRKQAENLLDSLGCLHLADRAPAALSGGEKQKVALARALMIEPRLLLLDEPLAALDARARRSIRAYLAEHLESTGTPAIVVTHDLRDVLALDAMVAVLEAGRIVQTGTSGELASNPATDFVADFFGLLDRSPVS